MRILGLVLLVLVLSTGQAIASGKAGNGRSPGRCDAEARACETASTELEHAEGCYDWVRLGTYKKDGTRLRASDCPDIQELRQKAQSSCQERAACDKREEEKAQAKKLEAQIAAIRKRGAPRKASCEYDGSPGTWSCQAADKKCPAFDMTEVGIPAAPTSKCAALRSLLAGARTVNANLIEGARTRSPEMECDSDLSTCKKMIGCSAKVVSQLEQEVGWCAVQAGEDPNVGNPPCRIASNFLYRSADMAATADIVADLTRDHDPRVQCVALTRDTANTTALVDQETARQEAFSNAVAPAKEALRGCVRGPTMTLHRSAESVSADLSPPHGWSSECVTVAVTAVSKCRKNVPVVVTGTLKIGPGIGNEPGRILQIYFQPRVPIITARLPDEACGVAGVHQPVVVTAELQLDTEGKGIVQEVKVEPPDQANMTCISSVLEAITKTAISEKMDTTVVLHTDVNGVLVSADAPDSDVDTACATERIDAKPCRLFQRNTASVSIAFGHDGGIAKIAAPDELDQACTEKALRSLPFPKDFEDKTFNVPVSF